MKPILFLKAHIKGYTRADGTYVAPHEDSRPHRTLYHGSGEHVHEVLDSGRFGGLFASGSRNSAASHGQIVHKIDLPEDQILTQHDLEYELDPDKVESALREAMPWLEDDDYETAYQAVIEDRSHKVDNDDLTRVFLEEDAGEASWEAQRVRGLVAKKLGYQAVEMSDEHGTSYLVLPGANIQREDEPIQKAILFFKAHPAAAGWRQPTEAQAKAGNYKKPRMRWRGMEIAIECPAGTVRSGRDRNGVEWSIRMLYPYGYIVGTMGVDGDPFDVYVGPDAEAPMVYVITTRVPGDWSRDDEQKAMIGFASEEDARAAFLRHYTDPRFLGEVRTMPADAFVDKVRSTRHRPAMLTSSPA